MGRQEGITKGMLEPGKRGVMETNYFSYEIINLLTDRLFDSVVLLLAAKSTSHTICVLHNL